MFRLGTLIFLAIGYASGYVTSTTASRPGSDSPDPGTPIPPLPPDIPDVGPSPDVPVGPPDVGPSPDAEPPSTG